MAFSEDNQNWIREEIQRAIHPNGLKKVANWLRYWSLLSVCIAAFIALIGLLITAGIFATNRISQEAAFRGSTEERLKNIETAIHEIRLKQVADNSTDPRSIKEVQSLLRTAKSGNLKISQDVLVEAGTNFIEAANKTPAAWNAALAFLDYRWFLNADLAPTTENFTKNVRFHWKLDISTLLVPPGTPPGQYQFAVTYPPLKVPHDEAAVVEHIGHPLNTDEAEGPGFVLLAGPALLHLDGYKLKNVIFRNVQIEYKGGPIRVENVYFVNCTFDFRPTPEAKQLSKAVLASVAVTFLSKAA